MRPKVSIIVPIYNVESYLSRCLQSLMNQTIKEIEIILIDDGSPDNCPRLCDAYASEDNRVKVIHKENEGLGFARNSGLEIATGEYVAFVDSDDFVDVHMYEELYEIAQRADLDVAYCGFYEYRDLNVIRKRQEVTEYTVFENDECHEVLHGMLSPCGEKGRITKFEMSVWHAIYRRDIFTRNNISFCSEREFISEDIIFHIDLIHHCRKIAFIPDAYYYYCLNESSLSKTYRRDRLQKVDILCEEVFRRVQEKAYKFPIEDCMFFACLSLRYPLTILKTYNIDGREKIEIIRDIVKSQIMGKWVDRVPWTKLPLRYMIFFYAIKMKWTALIFLVLK